MKRSNILITMFTALIATTPVVRAEQFTLDFDSKGSIPRTFMEAIKTPEKYGCVDIATVPAPTPTQVNVYNHKGEEYELNHSIGTAIEDCEKKGFGVLKNNFEVLLAKGILQEKRDFVYNSKQIYEFPRRLFTGTEEAVSNTATDLLDITKNCVVWETTQECTTGQKEVCHNICAAAVLVCLAATDGVGAPVCSYAAPVCTIACSFVSDTVCVPVKHCTQYATWPGQQPQAEPW